MVLQMTDDPPNAGKAQHKGTHHRVPFAALVDGKQRDLCSDSISVSQAKASLKSSM
jgi:hypothetical protein